MQASFDAEAMQDRQRKRSSAGRAGDAGAYWVKSAKCPAKSSANEVGIVGRFDEERQRRPLFSRDEDDEEQEDDDCLQSLLS